MKKGFLYSIISVLVISAAVYIVAPAKNGEPVEVFGQEVDFSCNRTIKDLLNGLLD